MKYMKKIVVGLLAAFAFSGALAQGATQPAPAQKADPAVMAAVTKLLATMNYRPMMEQAMTVAAQNAEVTARRMSDMSLQSNAKLTAEQKAKLKAQMDAKFPAIVEAMKKIFTDPTLLDEIQALTIQVYARHYTVAEIEQMAAFYATPVGQKVMRTMPQVMSESMSASQQIMEPRIGALMQDVMKIAEK